MTLRNSEVERHYQVTNLTMEGNLLRRLQALGLTIGTEIKVLNRKKSGSVIFNVRGTRLAVGTKIAGAIEVKEVNQEGRKYE